MLLETPHIHGSTPARAAPAGRYPHLHLHLSAVMLPRVSWTWRRLRSARGDCFFLRLATQTTGRPEEHKDGIVSPCATLREGPFALLVLPAEIKQSRGASPTQPCVSGVFDEVISVSRQGGQGRWEPPFKLSEPHSRYIHTRCGQLRGCTCRRPQCALASFSSTSGERPFIVVQSLHASQPPRLAPLSVCVVIGLPEVPSYQRNCGKDLEGSASTPGSAGSLPSASDGKPSNPTIMKMCSSAGSRSVRRPAGSSGCFQLT